mmetsp:Transcript_4539/g.5902  ORF Transcript_4539/g.5902 Transcript_4539/m.5902 type:complete len:107 (+) Transcript_4539:272-592(+)
MGKGKGKKPKQKNQLSKASLNKAGVILVDPERMRFQHSKIRPYFSGCGRSVKSTLDSIRNGDLNPADLPLIQVSVGNISFSCCFKAQEIIRFLVPEREFELNTYIC